MQFKCRECGKVFSNTSNLRKHARYLHKEKVDVIAPYIYRNAANYEFNCPCGKNFNNKADFLKHEKIHLQDHNYVIQAPNRIKNKKCPLCSALFTKRIILDHFKVDHDIVIESTIMDFKSLDEFHVWKNELEKNTKASFVKQTNKCTQKSNICYFSCNRSGTYVPKIKEDERKRHLKIQGSNKINGYCPASIKLTINIKNNACKVEYIDKHVGHESELGHITLSKDDRQKIAQKISRNIPFDEILNEVRKDVTELEVNRTHLLTRKDLCNIKQSFNLSSSAVRYPNDEISIEVEVPNISGKNDADDQDLHVHDDEQEESEEEKSVKKTLEEEKEEIVNKLAKHLKNINTLAELQIVKNILAPLSPTLAGLNSEAASTLPSSSTGSNKVPANKKITEQRQLFSSKKKISKRLCKKPKEKSLQNITINLLSI